jgi:hypothetical protein
MTVSQREIEACSEVHWLASGDVAARIQHEHVEKAVKRVSSLGCGRKEEIIISWMQNVQLVKNKHMTATKLINNTRTTMIAGVKVSIVCRIQSPPDFAYWF